jgi:hypothetical protein
VLVRVGNLAKGTKIKQRRRSELAIKLNYTLSNDVISFSDYLDYFFRLFSSYIPRLARPGAIPPGPKNEKKGGAEKHLPIFGPTWGQLPTFEFLVPFWIW